MARLRRRRGGNPRDPRRGLHEDLVDARETQQRVLGDIVGVADAAEHPVGDAEGAAPEGLESWSGITTGDGAAGAAVTGR
jgi:hypothetical protein